MKALAMVVCVLLLAAGFIMRPQGSDAQATPSAPANSGAGPTHSSSEPVVLSECESSRCDGTWMLNGSEGTAEWIGPIRANLRVMELSSTAIVIRRVDSLAPIPGLIATYRGTIKGQTIIGDVTWTCSGVGWPNNSGKWSAKLVSGSLQNLAAGAPIK